MSLHNSMIYKWLALAPALLLTGCGYQSTGDFNPNANAGYQWKSLYREDYQSVAVPIFTSRTFQRGAENELTRAVIHQMELRTPYKVVPRDRAQTILEGEIEGIEIRTLANDMDNTLPQQQAMTIRVNFVWKDIRTGRILCERRDFIESASFYPTLGEGRFIGTQAVAERLALAIVQELEADW